MPTEARNREYHFLFANDVEVIAWFKDRGPDANKLAFPGIPQSLMFQAFYICDITDCPNFKILKDKRANAKPGIPLPFIAAEEVDHEWFYDNGYLKRPAFWDKDINSMYPSLWVGGTSSGKSNFSQHLQLKIMKDGKKILNNTLSYISLEGSFDSKLLNQFSTPLEKHDCPLCAAGHKPSRL